MSNFCDPARCRLTQLHGPCAWSTADVPRGTTRTCTHTQQVRITKYGSRAEMLWILVRDLPLTVASALQGAASLWLA